MKYYPWVYFFFDLFLSSANGIGWHQDGLQCLSQWAQLQYPGAQVSLAQDLYTSLSHQGRNVYGQAEPW